MSFGQWASDYLGVPLEERFNFNPLTYFLYSGIDGAWFDPEDLSTMYQDAAGTTPVTALEQPVGRWLDKSGNGNHATQPITASRPTLSARYNLLTKTEDFADIAWSKINANIINTASTKNGVPITAGLVTNTASFGYFSQSDANTSNIKTAKFSFKSSSTNWVRLVIASVAVGSNAAGIFINTQTGAKGSVVIGGTGYSLLYSDSILRPDGWVDVTITVQGINEAMRPVVSIASSNGYVNAGIRSSMLVFAGQQSVGDKIIPYQRVNTATDYDSVGWSRYVRFDGIDDYLNLPYMGLYANGSASAVISAFLNKKTDTQSILTESSNVSLSPVYDLLRQLRDADGGYLDAIIRNDSNSSRLDSLGITSIATSSPNIMSWTDTGASVSRYKNSSVADIEAYIRLGTLTATSTTIGALICTTISGYMLGGLYSLIITKSALSDTDRRRCEQFLASRLSTLGVTLS